MFILLLCGKPYEEIGKNVAIKTFNVVYRSEIYLSMDMKIILHFAFVIAARVFCLCGMFIELSDIN